MKIEIRVNNSYLFLKCIDFLFFLCYNKFIINTYNKGEIYYEKN